MNNNPELSVAVLHRWEFDSTWPENNKVCHRCGTVRWEKFSCEFEYLVSGDLDRTSVKPPCNDTVREEEEAKLIGEIKLTKIRIEADIRTENTRHEARIKQLKAECKVNEKLCPHPDSAYFGDPAGGSDSYHECFTCGHQY